MIRFAEVFPDLSIVRTLSGQLGWSHFQLLIPLKDSLRIRVAEYLTELPPLPLLERKLHEAMALARTRLLEVAGGDDPP